MIPFPFLKQPFLTLCMRVLALAIILSITCVNINLMPEQTRKMKLGSIQDVSFNPREAVGRAVIDWTSLEANQMGISIGDIVLNPEAKTPGEIGTAVTFLIQSGDAPVREMTFFRQSKYYPGDIVDMLGLPPRALMYLGIILLWASIIFTALFGFAAFWLGLDGWMAFLVNVAVANLFAFLVENSGYAYFKLFLPSIIIFFLILFPNGKLTPRWAWMLLSLQLLHYVFFNFTYIWKPETYTFTYVASSYYYLYSPIVGLLIFGLILYRQRHTFTSIERQWMGAMILGLLLMNAPGWPFNTYRIFDWSAFAHSTIQIFGDLDPIAIWGALGILIYRYRLTFTLIERQQTKWLVPGLILSGALTLVTFIFNLYYLSSDQDFKAEIFSSIIDNFFLLAAIMIIFSSLLAILRYRLSDVDIFINRALVYCGLMLVLSVTCFLSILLIDNVFGQLPDNLLYMYAYRPTQTGNLFIDYATGKIPDTQSRMLFTVISIVILVVIFNPARVRLQNLVDKHFIVVRDQHKHIRSEESLNTGRSSAAIGKQEAVSIVNHVGELSNYQTRNAKQRLFLEVSIIAILAMTCGVIAGVILSYLGRRARKKG